MGETIFLQDIKNRYETDDNIFGYWSRDRIASAIYSIIKKIERQIENLYKLGKNPHLCQEEKEMIDTSLKERYSILLDRKTDLIKLRKKIENGGKVNDIEKEMEEILKSIPLQKFT